MLLINYNWAFSYSYVSYVVYLKIGAVKSFREIIVLDNDWLLQIFVTENRMSSSVTLNGLNIYSYGNIESGKWKVATLHQTRF